MTTQDGAAATVRALVEAWLESIRRHDLEGVLAQHATDIVFFDVPEPVQLRGIDAYRAAWDEFLGWVTTFEMQELEVVAGEDAAFCHGIVRCTGQTESTPFEVRVTMGFRKVDGAWQVTHEHHSVPSPA